MQMRLASRLYIIICKRYKLFHNMLAYNKPKGEKWAPFLSWTEPDFTTLYCQIMGGRPSVKCLPFK